MKTDAAYLARLAEMSRHLLTKQAAARVKVPPHRSSVADYVREFNRTNNLKGTP